MRTRLGIALLFSLATLIVPALPAQASGGLHCGDTITTDTVLTRNLVCAGTALNVATTGAAMVTVDLNGHRLKGNGTGTGISVTWDYRTYPQLGNLTVTNGTITGFATALLGANDHDFVLDTLSLTDLRLVSNGNWMSRSVRRQALVEDSSVIDSGSGGAHTDGGILVARNSQFIRSGIASGSESASYLYDNTFQGGGFVNGAISNLVATGNMFRDCDTAISMYDSYMPSPTQVDDNKFIHCQVGIDFGQMSGSVSVQRNLFSKNTQAGMVFVSAPFVDADIAGNSFLDNGGDGLTGTVWNPASYGGLDPTKISSVVRVTGNLAVRNAGHGINVAMVTDGGTNRARGNGITPQCLGVMCTRP